MLWSDPILALRSAVGQQRQDSLPLCAELKGVLAWGFHSLLSVLTKRCGRTPRRAQKTKSTDYRSSLIRGQVIST